MQTKSIQSGSKKSVLDFEYVDFKIEREDWNKYKLEDKAILKTKFVLINVFAEKGFRERIQKAKEKRDKAGFGLKFQSSTITGMEVPPNLVGSPSNERHTPQELEKSVVKEDIDFETITEAWNIYKLSGDLIMKVRNSPVSIRRTSKFDSEGIPIYLIDFSADIKIGPTR